MAYKQHSQNLSYVDRVLQRTREIVRIKTGKASETLGNPEYVFVQEDKGTVNGGNPQSFNPEIVMAGNSGNVSVTLAQGGTSGRDVHEKISNMESEKRKFESEQTDLLSNIVLNLAKMQQQLEKTISSEIVGDFAVGNSMTSPERSVNEDEMSDIFDSGVDSIEVNFLTHFDGLYEDNQKFGPNVDDKLAELLDRAIDKPMPKDKSKELSAKYLVPGNCKRLEVPVVNREMWTALKDKQEGDLAMQAIQKHLKTALVPNLMALEIYKNKGDQTQIPQLLKDGFKILANGICQCNRKRKALIKPGIPAKYRKVCNLDIPITENLFGDDIDSRVDEIERQEKRSQTLAGVGSGHFLYQRPAQKGRGSLSDKRIYMERDHDQAFMKGQKYGLGRFKGQSYRGKAPTQSHKGK